jgi:serine protease AprX
VNRFLLRPILLCVALWVVGAANSTGDAKLDSRIFAERAPDEKASFLVVLREQADLSGAETIADRTDRVRFVYESLRTQAELSQAPLRARLEAEGIAYRSYFLVNMLEVEGDRSLAASLAARQDVVRVAANSTFTPAPAPRDPQPVGARPQALGTVEPNITKIGAPDVWARGFTGQGIVIGMADTGVVWDHPALRTHYRGFDGFNVSHDYSWHDSVHDAVAANPCGSSSPTPCDDDGHGTSTAGLAVGDDGVGNQVGVAPGARFIACRNMDQGAGTPARYTECFQFFLAPTDSNGANPRPDLAAHVISNSWGCPASEGCTDPEVLRAVVENVRAAGIFVAVAAGNDGGFGCATINVPGLYGASFTVGATTLDDTIAGFSSRGPVIADGSNRLKPDICAPGVSLRVANKGGGYAGGFSGTSGSTPEVSGAVALLWSAAPSMKRQIDATASLLRLTALPLISAQDCPPFPGGAVPNAVFGYGRINIAAAVALALPVARAKPTAPAGTRVPRVVAPR